MEEARWERRGAASGFVALVLGGAGGALERGWPSASDPAAVARFVAENRTAILAQSMLFLLSSAVFLWFVGTLRAFLRRGEGGSGRLSAVAFGAGVAWIALGMAAQAFQIGVALEPRADLDPVHLWTMAAVFGIANLPCAVMLAAVAVVALRHRALPGWLGWLSVLGAAGQLLLFCGTVVRSGPLAPNGWLTYALYPLFLVWLVPAVIVMMRRSGGGPRVPA